MAATLPGPHGEVVLRHAGEEPNPVPELVPTQLLHMAATTVQVLDLHPVQPPATRTTVLVSELSFTRFVPPPPPEKNSWKKEQQQQPPTHKRHWRRHIISLTAFFLTDLNFCWSFCWLVRYHVDLSDNFVFICMALTGQGPFLKIYFLTNE